jgi:hypothetical protein
MGDGQTGNQTQTMGLPSIFLFIVSLRFKFMTYFISVQRSAEPTLYVAYYSSRHIIFNYLRC